MRRTKACLLLAALAAALALVLAPVSAHAESFTGKDGWQVTFGSNKQMGTNFSDADFADALGQVQPGDDITLSVGLKNAYSETTDFYVANKIMKAFEDSEAQGGAYSYRLTYTGPDGKSKTLYESASIGGDDNNGLNDVDSGLADFLYLGSIEPGKEGRVELYVKLDGETQGNDYMRKLADLKLSFAAEIPEGKEVTKTVRKTVPQTSTVTTSVNTGDTTQLLPLFVALGVSGLVLLALAVDNVRRSRAEGKEDLR
ncbi:MAG: hypothetical protein IKE22_11855 [Atopobiaceae bacterium]|nr:hypothetical protein [Atopobiaceae bacterium]